MTYVEKITAANITTIEELRAMEKELRADAFKWNCQYMGGDYARKLAQDGRKEEAYEAEQADAEHGKDWKAAQGMLESIKREIRTRRIARTEQTDFASFVKDTSKDEIEASRYEN